MTLNNLTTATCVAIIFAGSSTLGFAQADNGTNTMHDTMMNSAECPDTIAPGSASGATNPGTTAGSGAGVGDVVGTTTGSVQSGNETETALVDCPSPNGDVGNSGGAGNSGATGTSGSGSGGAAGN